MNIRRSAAFAVVALTALASSPVFSAPTVALEPVRLNFPGIWPPPDLEVRASDGILSVRRPSRNGGLLIVTLRKRSGENVVDERPAPKYGESWAGAIDEQTQKFTLHLQDETAMLEDEHKNFLWSGPTRRIPREQKSSARTVTVIFTGEQGTAEIRDGNGRLLKTQAVQLVRVSVRDADGQPMRLPFFNSNAPQTPDVKLTAPGTVYVAYRDQTGAFVSARKMTLLETGELYAAPCDETGKKIGYTYKSFTTSGFRAEGRK